jgi:hypothetical protein
MLLSPEGFARAWGIDSLIQLPSRLATAPISKVSREFLVRAGLPALIRYFEGVTKGLITFCRLDSGLDPVLGEKTVGPPLPSEWSVYWILGDEFFCNGSAWWCLHGPTGRVDRIDIEIDPPISFANSSVAHFASALLIALLWSNQPGHSPTEWPSEVAQFKHELADLDPACLQSDRNFWPMYLDFISSEGPQKGAFERGSRAEGERAFQTGPW